MFFPFIVLSRTSGALQNGIGDLGTAFDIGSRVEASSFEREAGVSGVQVLASPTAGRGNRIYLIDEEYCVKVFPFADQVSFDVEAGFLEQGLTDGVYDAVAVDRGVHGLLNTGSFVISRVVDGCDAGGLRDMSSRVSHMVNVAFAAGQAMSKLHLNGLDHFGRFERNGTTNANWEFSIERLLEFAQIQKKRGIITEDVVRRIDGIADHAIGEQPQPVITHGDPKPEHIILGREGWVLIDFDTAQGSLPIRDALQYVPTSSGFLDDQGFINGVLGESYEFTVCDFVIALRRSLGLSMHAYRTNDSMMINIMREVINDLSHGHMVTSIEGVLAERF